MTAALLILRKVPAWVWLAVALLAWGGWHRHMARAAAEREKAAVLAQEKARGDALHAGVVETARRLNVQQEAANAAEQRSARAEAAARRAAAAGDSLRADAAALAASAAACRPAAAAVGAPASAPADLLADMLGRLDEAGRELAREADRRGIRGDECAARYDALTAKP